MSECSIVGCKKEATTHFWNDISGLSYYRCEDHLEPSISYMKQGRLQGESLIKKEAGQKEMSEKVAQCRYCVNSSNEEQGIWLGDLWICMPCFVSFEAERFSDMLKLQELIFLREERLLEDLAKSPSDTTTFPAYVTGYAEALNDFKKDLLLWTEKEAKKK